MGVSGYKLITLIMIFEEFANKPTYLVGLNVTQVHLKPMIQHNESLQLCVCVYKKRGVVVLNKLNQS